MTNIVGARWWKTDLHTHTPCSSDFGKGPDQATLRQATPEAWLMAFMAAGVDCVAVTDHNGGGWFDTLALGLKALARDRPAGYRDLHLFPGVEVTASGGVHVLGILPPDKSGTDIAALLGALDYAGAHGAADGMSPQSSERVIAKIAERGGLAILAHVDQARGAFVVLEGQTLAKVVEHSALAAIERRDPDSTIPPVVTDRRLRLTEIAASDAHHLSPATGVCFPGSRFTWIKMGQPSFDGLRLALIDGNDFSVRRSDTIGGDFDPNRTPDNWIEAIEITDAKYVGRSQPLQAPFSPWSTALVGGRGTGKSSVVHFLRAVLNRDDELTQFDEKTGPRATRDRFFKVSHSRSEEGALLDTTGVSATYHHEGSRFRIHWRQDVQQARVEEWLNGTWHPATSQDVRSRFPVRMFSQGQILAMTDGRSDALLALIDEAIGARSWRERLTQAEAAFLAARAKQRELAQRVASGDRVLGQLDDVQKKLAKFEETQHASVLREFQRRNRQARQIESQTTAVKSISQEIGAMATRIVVPEVPADVFDASDHRDGTAVELLSELRAAVGRATEALSRSATDLSTAVTGFHSAVATSSWMAAVDEARRRHEELLTALRAQGVQDPDEYARLVQDRQQLENEVAHIESLKERIVTLTSEANSSLSTLVEIRRELRSERRRFVEEKLADNPFVRITVDGYGRDPAAIERSFRELINVLDERFATDIYQQQPGAAIGLVSELLMNLPGAGDLAETTIEGRLGSLKSRWEQAALGRDVGLGGHFANFLQRETQRRPDMSDRLHVWFPEDSVRVDYSPGGDGADFRPITQASAGQRASAMLAFLLAYGNDPIVLDQPEDDLDNHLIYDLLVRQVRLRKQHRQVIVVSHNPNVVVNGDVELVHVFDFFNGECRIIQTGCLQDEPIRKEICTVMEGGREAFERRYRRLGAGGRDV